jgi:hypothetical protein
MYAAACACASVYVVILAVLLLCVQYAGEYAAYASVYGFSFRQLLCDAYVFIEPRTSWKTVAIVPGWTILAK